MKVGVMQGQLREFHLAEVLQVVGIGRQYTGVEVRYGNGLSGTIFVKSGKVVHVDAPPSVGKQAFFDLFRDSDGHFFVFRTETPAMLPEPLGQMQNLLMEVASSRPPQKAGPSAPILTTSSAPVSSIPASAISSGRGFEEVENPTRMGVAPPAAPIPREARGIPIAEPPNGDAGIVRTRSSRAPAAVRPSVLNGRRPPDGVSGEHALGRIVAVASPKGGSGKTTVALNLALALARQGHPVTLVDADINGDVLSAINARSRAEVGTFDLLDGWTAPERGLLQTVLPHFRILPAIGATLPDPEVLAADHSVAWQRLLTSLASVSHVIVDTPAGMFGVTRQVLTASTHVLAVLQAEVVAHRSFERFREAIDGIPDEYRPEVLGVILNMLQMRQSASVSVLQSVCAELPQPWLFETSIPRHPAFIDATAQGLPVRHLDEQAPPAVAWLFDNLAAEVADRLQLARVERRPQPLLI